MLKNAQIMQIFDDTQSVFKGHFLLTSGRHADTYMQCAKVFSHPDISMQACGLLVEKLHEFDIDVVVSPAMGGIVMGYEVARQLNVKNFFFERVNGQFELRRGFEIAKDAKVLVVEDVVTTGGSVREVVQKVRELGGQVVGVAVIVDRSAGQVEFDVPFVSLLSMEIKSYAPEECPICQMGIPLVKPGSRGN